MFCFTSTLTLYFAKMISKCKLVGVVSKERMRTYMLSRSMLASWSWLSFAVLVLSICVWFVAPDMVDLLWVSAEVKRGSVVLILPTVLPATAEDTFGSLLEKVASGQSLDSELQVETVQKVTISGASSTVHVVPLNAPVLMVSTVVCQCIGLGHARKVRISLRI